MNYNFYYYKLEQYFINNFKKHNIPVNNILITIRYHNNFQEKKM